MSSKTLFIYNSYKLFEILNEIKEYLNFEIYYIDKGDYEKIDSNKFVNYLVVTVNSSDDIKNSLLLDKFPEKLSQIIEKINLNFLKNKFINQSELQIGKYILDLNARKIYLQKKSIDLTEKESDLILFLNSNEKVSLKELQKEVWGYSSDLETHTVETHIYRLRKKILKNFNDNNFIKYNKEGYFLN